MMGARRLLRSASAYSCAGPAPRRSRAGGRCVGGASVRLVSRLRRVSVDAGRPVRAARLEGAPVVTRGKARRQGQPPPSRKVAPSGAGERSRGVPVRGIPTGSRVRGGADMALIGVHLHGVREHADHRSSLDISDALEEHLRGLADADGGPFCSGNAPAVRCSHVAHHTIRLRAVNIEGEICRRDHEEARRELLAASRPGAQESVVGGVRDPLLSQHRSDGDTSHGRCCGD